MSRLFVSARRLTLASLLAFAGSMLLGATANAAIINIPDGQFDTANGTGTAGGGLIFGNPATTKIGSTPWSATYSGLSIFPLTLAAPTLSIGGGVATISGVSSLLSQQNGGYFSQTLSTAYTGATTYTLGADVMATGLTAAILGNSGVGIALTDSLGNVLSSSNNNGANLTVNLVGGSTYHLDLTYTTTATQTGGIGIRLFDMPNGIANVNVLSSVSFDNVTLQTSSVITNAVPEPGSLTLLGLGLVTSVGAAGWRRGRSSVA